MQYGTVYSMSQVTVPAAGAPAGTKPAGTANARLINYLILAIFDIGLSILVFTLVDNATSNKVYAYLAASIGPLLGGIIQQVRSKHFSGVSALILLFNLLSAGVALVGGGDERMLLVKDSAITGIFGLVFLGSLLAARPMGFYFGQRFATDGTAESEAYWDGLWQYESFRASQRTITIVWGVVFLIEAAARIIAAYTLPFSTAFAVSNVLPFAALAVALTLTFVIAGRTKRKAARA